MARSKLLSALDAHKGRNYKLERDKKLRKEAEKKKAAKRRKIAQDENDEQDQDEAEVQQMEVDDDELDGGVSVKFAGKDVNTSKPSKPDYKSSNGSGMGDEATDEAAGAVAVADNHDTAASSDEAATDHDEDGDEEDIPLSDLDSLPGSEKEDIIPHQRLTINNTAALKNAVASISLPTTTTPFSEHQSLVSTSTLSIPDVNDDIVREQVFYETALTAARDARSLLKKEGVPFTRPADYFAEMVKSDEHMERIKMKLRDEAAGKKASVEAKKMRDLKKFGKQVQVAKLQERDRARKQSMEKINALKRKRKSGDTGATADEDLFDIALEDEGDKGRKGRSGGRGLKGGDGAPGIKRAKKDAKFGFGGKKRFAKSGDALSSADMKGFSMKKMKGQGQKRTKRLGKSKRKMS